MALLVGCDRAPPGDEAPDPPRTEAPAERRMADVRWDTVVRIGGTVEDTSVLMPYLLVASPSAVFVFDYGDLRVRSFGLDGRLRWSRGRRGEGPGEFVNAFDIELSDSLVWVLDEGAGRVTLLDRATGDYRGQIPLRERFLRDVVPVPGGRFLGLLVGPGETFVAEIDRSGRMVAGLPYPTAALRAAPFPLRMPVSAIAGPAAGAPLWAALFPHGDDLLVYRGTELLCRGRRVGGVPFAAQTGPRPSVTAADIAFAGSSVLVLAADSGGHRLRTLDEYDARDCRYLRSYRLPVRTTAIAASDGRIVVQHEDPAPGLLILRPAAREGGS